MHSSPFGYCHSCALYLCAASARRHHKLMPFGTTPCPSTSSEVSQFVHLSPQTYVFMLLRSRSHDDFAAVHGTIPDKLRLFRAASIGEGSSIPLKVFSHKSLRLSSTFLPFSLCLSWLILPAHAYSLKRRSTRKQRTTMSFNSGLFLVSRHKASTQQRRTMSF